MKVESTNESVQIIFTDKETNQPLLPEFIMRLSNKQAWELARDLLEAIGQSVDNIDRMRFAHEVLKHRSEQPPAKLIVAALEAWEEKITSMPNGKK